MRRFALVLVLLFVMLPLAAQDDAPDCYSLSPDDCALYFGALEVAGALTSADFTFAGEFRVKDFGGIPDLAIFYYGEGAFEVDPGVLRQLISDGTGDLRALVEGLVSVLQSSRAEVTLSINIPSRLAEIARLDATTLVLDAKVIDGIAYLNATAPEPDMRSVFAGLGPGWWSIELAALAQAWLVEYDTFITTYPPAALTPEQLADLNERFYQYVTIEREANISTDLALFRVSTDVAGVYGDDLVETMFPAILQNVSLRDVQEMQAIASDMHVWSEHRIDLKTGQMGMSRFTFDMDLSRYMQRQGIDANPVVAFYFEYSLTAPNMAVVTLPPAAPALNIDWLVDRLSGR